MCVVYVHVCVYVLVRKRTFDWLDGLKLSSLDGFTFSRACTFYEHVLLMYFSLVGYSSLAFSHQRTVAPQIH